MESFLLLGLPLWDPLAFEGSFRALSASLSYAIWFFCPLGSSPSAWGSLFCPYLFSHRVPVLWFSWLFQLLSPLPPPLPLAIARVSSLSCASFGDTVSSWRSVPSAGGFLLLAWVLASPLLLHGFGEWRLPWVLTVYLQWSAFLPWVCLPPSWLHPSPWVILLCFSLRTTVSFCQRFSFLLLFFVGLSPLGLSALAFFQCLVSSVPVRCSFLL